MASEAILEVWDPCQVLEAAERVTRGFPRAPWSARERPEHGDMGALESSCKCVPLSAYGMVA
eukprot:299759-Pyramimonas_sp.AAC.1